MTTFRTEREPWAPGAGSRSADRPSAVPGGRLNATEAALATGADVVDLVVQDGLLDREEAMALLTPVPLNSALLSGG
ncbi:hypothetical protein [Streptomyces sp. NBC_00286]|uniref:hypothetical protein n=1 Tax=Streptomyces sp. NBC_00286 TaxID=2975701 RepID=UPI002E2B0D3F|nr:hypothetical protein [Streptomyces sp. NBC_00286]